MVDFQLLLLDILVNYLQLVIYLFILDHNIFNIGFGFELYRLFKSVIILTQVQRQAGNNAASVRFRELLLRLRDMQPTFEDWNFLCEQQSSKIDNIEEYFRPMKKYLNTI